MCRIQNSNIKIQQQKNYLYNKQRALKIYNNFGCRFNVEISNILLGQVVPGVCTKGNRCSAGLFFSRAGLDIISSHILSVSRKYINTDL